MKFNSIYKYIFLILSICIFIVPTQVYAFGGIFDTVEDWINGKKSDFDPEDINVSFAPPDSQRMVKVTLQIDSAKKKYYDDNSIFADSLYGGSIHNVYELYPKDSVYSSCSLSTNAKSVVCTFKESDLVNGTIKSIPVVNRGSNKIVDVTIKYENSCDNSKWKNGGSKELQNMVKALQNRETRLRNCDDLNSCSYDTHFDLLNEYTDYLNSLTNKQTEYAAFQNCSPFNSIQSSIDEITGSHDKAEEKYSKKLDEANIPQEAMDAYNNAYRRSVLAGKNSRNNDYSNSSWGGNTLTSEDYCDTMYSDIFNIANTIYDWIRIIAPILLIIFGSLDFGKAVISNDREALQKATSSFVKRAICTIGIFFLPLIVNLIMSWPGISDFVDSVGQRICELTF